MKKTKKAAPTKLAAKKVPKLARTTRKEDAGKFLLDLSKLLFGSFCLGGVLRGEVPHVILIISGFIGAGVLFLIGLRLVEKELPPDKDGGE